MSKKYYPCDCGWAAHNIVVERGDESWSTLVEIYITMCHTDHSFIKRLKIAWLILKGDDHSLSGIVLDNVQAKNLAEYILSLDLDE